MRISEWRNREKRVSNELRNFVRTDREDFENFSLRFFFPFQFLLEYPFSNSSNSLNHHSTIYPSMCISSEDEERERGYLHTFRVITGCISKNYVDIGVVSGKFFLSLPSPPGERPFPLATLDEKQGGKSCRAITRFLSP